MCTTPIPSHRPRHPPRSAMNVATEKSGIKDSVVVTFGLNNSVNDEEFRVLNVFNDRTEI